MPVFITVKARGDHERLFAAYDRIAAYEESKVPELGCHLCSKTPEGIFVAGTWETLESFERLMASEAFRKLLQECALPHEPEIEVFEIYKSRHGRG